MVRYIVGKVHDAFENTHHHIANSLACIRQAGCTGPL